jgi:hypothetical protein
MRISGVEGIFGEASALRAGLLAADYRDVIVAGEYEAVEGKLARVRDLTMPF